MKQTGILLVVTGPTASGKDAVVESILKKTHVFKKVITTTTRTPRPGEKNGVNYFFVSIKDFHKMGENQEFLETNEYGGNFYGTTKKEIHQVLARQDLVWRIDPSAAAKIKSIISKNFPKDAASELISKTIVIYLSPESAQVLISRLKGRGFSGSEIDQRLNEENMLWEKYQNKFPYVIINKTGYLDKTVANVLALVQERKESL
ncbi:hypothetical protein HYW42_05210 [Candidatus Daviesbacteria bacterium]|nr:hypothetical protein [Candidatus Daviesbacteria bacterium]